MIKVHLNLVHSGNFFCPHQNGINNFTTLLKFYFPNEPLFTHHFSKYF